MDNPWKSYCRWFSHTVLHFNGHFRNLNWRYLPYIRPIFQAYVRKYPHKIWPEIWSSTSILGSWNSHWSICNISCAISQPAHDFLRPVKVWCCCLQSHSLDSGRWGCPSWGDGSKPHIPMGLSVNGDTPIASNSWMVFISWKIHLYPLVN